MEHKLRIPLILVFTLAFLAKSHSMVTNEDLNASDLKKTISVSPNPVKYGKIYISSKYNSTKTVEIFDVLGNRVFVTSINGKELNVSELRPGVYIIKISQAEISVTRKLIVKRL